jgi:hypothetical protein
VNGGRNGDADEVAGCDYWAFARGGIEMGECRWHIAKLRCVDTCK